MSVSRKQFALSALVLAVVAAGGGIAVSSSHAHAEAAPAGSPPPAAVDVATVVQRSITDWQSYSGRLEAVDKVDIRPQVSGILTTVAFHDGSLVQKGDLLFTIDPRPFQAEVERTQAQLAAADAQNSFTAANLARAQRLIKDKAISQVDLEQAQNAASAAAAASQAARAALDEARLNLGYTHITAPVSGRVSRAEVTPGNLVAAGNAQALTTVVSVAQLYAAFDVDEQSFLNDINPARSGKAPAAPVFLGLANESGYSHQGVVSSVDNHLDTTSGTIRVRAQFDNSDGALLPGLYARILLGSGQPRPGLLIDEKAVSTDQDKRFVLVVGADNKANYREVKLGAQQDGLRVVQSGLAAGDRIVVDGLQHVRPGDPVTPHAVAMPDDTGPSASPVATRNTPANLKG